MPNVRGHYKGNTTRGPESAHWRGGRQVEWRGYVYRYVPDHPFAVKSPRGYVFEHRLVMEEHIGRPLSADEIVHHKNGVKNDNAIANLELWVKTHPKGQRVTDLLAFAHDILARYEAEEAQLRLFAG